MKSDMTLSYKPRKLSVSRTIINATLIIGALVLALYGHISVQNQQYQWFSLLPVVSVLSFALCTHRSIESLVFGCLVAVVLISPDTIIQTMINTNLAVLSDGVTGWVAMISFLIGGLIALINFSGGAKAFCSSISGFSNNRSRTLLASWVMGLIIFIDDYMNALAVSSTMKPLIDKYRISREMFAYVVDSTAAPMCVLVPISTWAIFLIGLFESLQVFPEGQGFSGYLSIIPYMFYAWFAILLVPLVSKGWIPVLGAMKAAEKNAQSMDRPVEKAIHESHIRPRLINFLLPLAVFMVATLYFENDTLNGVVVAFIVTFALLWLQKAGSLSHITETAIDGFNTMMQPVLIVITAFVLQRFNSELGFSEFIITSVTPYMNAALLPAMTFIILSALAFATGSFWGIYAIALPVIFPLAQALDANIPLTIGAFVSAGVFGSHACFFGDATVITAKGAGCEPFQHAITQLPYALIAAFFSTILFLVLA
ncbi:sodium:proton antiporter [Marinomonas sp. CT5]|uniref:Na+/H+ antiporter NhaC family protein n=1 Tax=Marinomonas sp. CT5 TaxID=2066133 RepID=UPI001BAF6584|nr:Na+/H+ antiporter NhaC family protein [Marinomonas sp. CT5]QUX97525.1 sodium:proton antiporter [Marinomonas sp. CT5]